MTAGPSPAAGIDAGLFVYPRLEERLLLVRHLTEFSELPIVLTGPAGSGKTAFARYLASEGAEPHWNAVFVKGQPTASRPVLLDALATGLDLEARAADEVGEGGIETATRALAQRIEYLKHTREIAVAIVDDADTLPADGLKCLIDLARDTGLRIVLVADRGVALPVDGQAGDPGFPHQVELPALTAEDVPAFVRALAGRRGETPGRLGDTEITALIEASGGVPGALETLIRQRTHGRRSGHTRRASQALKGVRSRLAGMRTRPRLGRFAAPAAVAGAIAAVGLGVALLLPAPPDPHEDIELARPSRLPATTADGRSEAIAAVGERPSEAGRAADVPAREPEIATPPTGRARPRPDAGTPPPRPEAFTTSTATAASGAPATVAGDEPPDPAAADDTPEAEPDIPGPADTTPAASTEEPGRAATDTTGQADRRPRATEPRSGTARENDAPSPTAPVPAKAPVAPATAQRPDVPTRAQPDVNAAPDADDAALVPMVAARRTVPAATAAPAPGDGDTRAPDRRTDPDGTFSIQVLGSRDKSAVYDFVEGLDVDLPRYVAQTVHQGKPWYIGLVGGFPSRTSAAEAIARLPASLRQHGPWPKDLSDLDRSRIEHLLP